MALRLVQVDIKARDDVALARFWAEALGWASSIDGPGATSVQPAGTVYPDPAAFCVDVVTVPDPDTVVYRAHLHLWGRSAAHHPELVDRLERAGATSLGGSGIDTCSALRVIARSGSGVTGVSMVDPQGTPFCVLAPGAPFDDTGAIAAVVVDCDSPRRMAEFWATATDWTLHSVTDDLARLRSSAGVGPYLELVRTPEADRRAGRAHLDLRPYPGDDQALEVERLTGLGATLADIGQGDVPWVVLTDVEGNEFCVLTPG
ncbi:MAG: hypothetical protein RI885_2746 [Actinomycetota bacterium]